jgi:hypothetical protein
MRPFRAALTRARPPVPRFPATCSDDLGRGRIMTSPVAIQEQSSVFFVDICVEPCRGWWQKATRKCTIRLRAV